MNAYVYFTQALPHTDQRAHLTVNFANVLGGFDELLHGSSHLQGWAGRRSPTRRSTGSPALIPSPSGSVTP